MAERLTFGVLALIPRPAGFWRLGAATLACVGLVELVEGLGQSSPSRGPARLPSRDIHLRIDTSGMSQPIRYHVTVNWNSKFLKK